MLSGETRVLALVKIDDSSLLQFLIERIELWVF